MTNAASANHDDFWNFDFLIAPRPNLDSELLQNLGFIPGLKELLMLRQVHALEHATVWVLSELDRAFNSRKDDNDSFPDNETIGGLSTEKGFYLYGDINPLNLKRAVSIALSRLTKGEWELAVHPRCGTNLSVELLLTAGMVFTTYLLLPREPIGQLIGLGIATTTATWIAPEIGISVQKYLTTAIPFNLKINEIAKTLDKWGRPAHFVSVKWQNSQ